MNFPTSSWTDHGSGLPAFAPAHKSGLPGLAAQSPAGPQMGHSDGNTYPYVVSGILDAEHTNGLAMRPTGWRQDSEDEELKRQRHKHKLVEQSRREKTRALTAELQTLVPGLQEFEKTNMNVVLEGVLDYLKNTPVTSAINGRRHEKPGQSEGRNAALCPAAAPSIPIPKGVFHRAFDTAPMGVAMTSVNGQIIWYNSMFNNMFVDGSQVSNAPTMFTLTAPEDLPRTMQVL